MKLRIFILAFLVWAVLPQLVSCASSSDASSPDASQVNYSVIGTGNAPVSGVQGRKIEVYTDQTTFNSSFTSFVAPAGEHTIDFLNRKAILLSLGSSSASRSIYVDKIEDQGAFIKASITIRVPGSGCVAPAVETSPFQFIEVESAKPIFFEERVAVVDCE